MKAPFDIASTADSPVPWPVRRMTAVSGWLCFARARMARPSRSCITRSVMIRSKLSSSMILAPSTPEAATRQRKPTRSRLSATVSAWARSLSMIRTCAGVAGASSGVAAGVWEREVETVITADDSGSAGLRPEPHEGVGAWPAAGKGPAQSFRGNGARPSEKMSHAKAGKDAKKRKEFASVPICQWPPLRLRAFA